MINTAEITSGHYQGSSQLIVECNETDGTDIVVYRYTNGVQTLVGSGVIGNSDFGAGISLISLYENIAIGNILQACVDEFGKQSGEPVIVYESGENIKTGWRNPQTVFDGTNETSYDNYFAAGGVEIASKYAPESTINNTVVRIGNIPRNFIDFYIEVKYSTDIIDGDIKNICIVTVKGFSDAIGNPYISWDGSMKEQIHQKTYLAASNGNHTIEVFPEAHTLQSKSGNFNVNIATIVLDPETADIWESSYEINPEASRSVALNAYSFYPLECRIVGLGGGTFAAMTGNIGSRWAQAPILNVPSGTYVGEIRVTGTTAVKTVDVRITF